MRGVAANGDGRVSAVGPRSVALLVAVRPGVLPEGLSQGAGGSGCGGSYVVGSGSEGAIPTEVVAGAFAAGVLDLSVGRVTP